MQNSVARGYVADEVLASTAVTREWGFGNVETLMHRLDRPIDPVAARMPWMNTLSRCLHIPIAARNEGALQRFVGTVASVRRQKGALVAVVVNAYRSHPPDLRLPFWKEADSCLLHATAEIWVHIDYRRLVPAYVGAVPDCDLTDRKVTHMMDPHIARRRGFSFLRVLPLRASARRPCQAADHRGLSQAGKLPSLGTDRAEVEYASRSKLAAFVGVALDDVTDDSSIIVAGLFRAADLYDGTTLKPSRAPNG